MKHELLTTLPRTSSSTTTKLHQIITSSLRTHLLRHLARRKILSGHLLPPPCRSLPSSPIGAGSLPTSHTAHT
ncbi:hypothetical protein CsSME_00010220 [Camellia sinensis var. sinensis]